MSAAGKMAETLFQSLKCINSRRRHFEESKWQQCLANARLTESLSSSITVDEFCNHVLKPVVIS
jgi:hypothetical protein